MVRNFGERRKKKRGQNKKSKPKGSKSQGYKGIPQEEVTCREVAIYVPPTEENSKEVPKTTSKNTENAYRSRRNQRYRRARGTRPSSWSRPNDDDYDDYHYYTDADDDDEYFDYDVNHMLHGMLNMFFVDLQIRRNRFIIQEMPMLSFLMAMRRR